MLPNPSLIETVKWNKLRLHSTETTSWLLYQSTVSHRVGQISSSEANSICCHKSETQYIAPTVESIIIVISNNTDIIIRKIINVW